MRKVGDYSWRQVSMWDSTPENCIEKCVVVGSDRIACRFFLKRITEIVSDKRWKEETITALDGVPEEILNWRNDNYRVKVNRGEG